MSEAHLMPSWLNANISSPLAAKASWLKDFQAAEWTKCLKRGLPTRKEELWKYTDVKNLAEAQFALATVDAGKLSKLPQLENSLQLVFVNGFFRADLSRLENLLPGMIIAPLSQAIDTYPELIKPALLQEFDLARNPFANLNSALLSEGVFIYLPKACLFTQPIHLLYLNTQHHSINHLRTLIIAEEQSSVVF